MQLIILFNIYIDNFNLNTIMNIWFIDEITCKTFIALPNIRYYFIFCMNNYLFQKYNIENFWSFWLFDISLNKKFIYIYLGNLDAKLIFPNLFMKSGKRWWLFDFNWKLWRSTKLSLLNKKIQILKIWYFKAFNNSVVWNYKIQLITFMNIYLSKYE